MRNAPFTDLFVILVSDESFIPRGLEDLCTLGRSPANTEGNQIKTMLRTAITFFIIALIAILLGAGGVGSLAMNIGYVLAVIGVILFVVNAVTGRA